MTIKRDIPEDIKETNIKIIKRIKPTNEPSWLGHSKDCCIIDNELIKGATKEELASRSGREISGVLGHISHLKTEHGLAISQNKGIYRLEYMHPQMKKMFSSDELDELMEENIEVVVENCIVELEDKDQKLKWYSINIDSPTYKNNAVTSLAIEKGFAKALLGKKVNDFVNFGTGFKVVSIRKYQS